tara:strand:- start:1441 stop:1605 length:165 start_codon:yes stop_codon:yes gene_type:complete
MSTRVVESDCVSGASIFLVLNAKILSISGDSKFWIRKFKEKSWLVGFLNVKRRI